MWFVPVSLLVGVSVGALIFYMVRRWVSVRHNPIISWSLTMPALLVIAGESWWRTCSDLACGILLYGIAFQFFWHAVGATVVIFPLMLRVPNQ